MYTNLYVYKALPLYMSGKLYWRYKKDGKWTWKPAKVVSTSDALNAIVVRKWEEEE